MKIAFDASALVLPITGIGRYTQQLAKQLDLLKKYEDEIIYFYGPKYKESHYIRRDIIRSKHTHRNGIRGIQTIWEQLVLPKKLKKYEIDVYHSPRNKNIPYLKIKDTKIIVTMHDTLAFLYPRKSIDKRILLWRWKRVAKLADKIITVSNNSKKDLLTQFDFLQNQDVIVNYCGIDNKFKKENIESKRSKEVLAKYNINKPYLLATGSTEPVKNIKMIIKVMRRGVAKYKNIFVKHELIIAGPKWPGKDIPDNLPENVRFIGYVEDRELPILMNQARLFLFPSLYEGFGLPPLEALAAGTDVISSNTSSLPEVLGDAAVMISPKDENLWLYKIKDILEKGKSKEFSSIRQTQIDKFSWQRSAEEIYEIYKEVHTD